MLRIDIHLPRSTLRFLSGAALFAFGFFLHALLVQDPTENYAQAEGGLSRQETVQAAESEVQSIRAEQAVLERREEILRYQLERLIDERRSLGGRAAPELEAELRHSEQMLLSLLLDQKEAERLLRQSLLQLWEAEGRALALTRGVAAGPIAIAWPVEPTLGISAGFEDPSYEARFGIPHKAIDIPVLQGTIVVAAADGVVEDVVDNGLGFNSVTLDHGGYATLYGHVESFLVEPGQHVRKGEPIARSGGRPGTPGAGHLSTGPHLHFELFVGGERVDPEGYLPEIRS